MYRTLQRHTTMTTCRRPQIASRKQPQQVRSTELVAAILQAAAQVLAEEGATRFAVRSMTRLRSIATARRLARLKPKAIR